MAYKYYADQFQNRIVTKYNDLIIYPVNTINDRILDNAKDMYDFPQAGQLAYNTLVQNLQTGDYTPSEHTPGLLRHKTHAIKFCLIVDDFGIRLVHTCEAQHFLDHLYNIYKTRVNWDDKVILRSAFKV